MPSHYTKSPSKKSEQPADSLIHEKSPSGLGKTLLTQKPSSTDDVDNPMKKKVGYQN